tara:strand:+ start:876 stop:1280 length:405 start_codon:yes stop_codon:yes gene_type:complete
MDRKFNKKFKKQLEEIKRQGNLSARAVRKETIDTFVEINEIMAQLEFDRDRLSTGGTESLNRYWDIRNGFVVMDSWIETIEKFKEIEGIIKAIEFDRDRLSTGGTESLNRYWRVRDSFVANRGGDIKEILERKD